MQFPTAKDFFETSNFIHETLFQAEEPVWNALLRLKDYLFAMKLGVIEGDVHEGAYLINPGLISIGKGSVVEAGAYICGPCIIGKNCEVRHGAYIRGNFICGDKCVIGHATEIKNAIFLHHAKAGHFAYIGDSILGNDVNLGAGTKCANLRLDHETIQVTFEGKKISTGLKKLGAILGDSVQTGCNAATNPGTLMAKKSACYPCCVVGGYVPEGIVIKGAKEGSAWHPCGVVTGFIPPNYILKTGHL